MFLEKNIHSLLILILGIISPAGIIAFMAVFEYNKISECKKNTIVKLLNILK